jgi:hypothetical protein
MWGAIASAGLGSLLKLGAVIKQHKASKQAGKEAKAMEAKGYNKYNKPEAFREREAMVRNQYLDPKMLGQRELEDKLGAKTANQISTINRTAGSGAEAMLGLGMAQKNLNNSLVDTSLNAMAQRYSDFNNYLGMLQQKSQYQDKEWEINKWTPYQQKLAEKQALEGAKRENLQNFFSDIGNLGAMGYQMKNMGGSNIGRNKNSKVVNTSSSTNNNWNLTNTNPNLYNFTNWNIDPNQAQNAPFLTDDINAGRQLLNF